MGEVSQGRSCVQWLEETSRLLQEGFFPEEYKEVKSRRTDYGITYSEVTPACLVSSPGR